jgi:hypothetical protein
MHEEYYLFTVTVIKVTTETKVIYCRFQEKV